MRYLNAVYVTDHRARVSRSKGSLLVATELEKRRVPLEAIDSVTLLGGGHMTTDALAACAERQIRVAALRRGGAIRFTVAGPRGGNVHLRVAQHRVAADETSSLNIARLVIAAKLRSSHRAVLRWARDTQPPERSALTRRADLIADRLDAVPSARDANHLRGIEGDAARAYFTGMGIVLRAAGVRFESRTRRPPRDPANALLGFSYGLLTTELVGACEAVGLDHQVGFLHRARSGRPSLALDLLEELRPLVDRMVVRSLRRRQLTEEDFTVTPGGATYLGDEGRAKFLRLWEESKAVAHPHRLLDRPVERWALPSVQATLLARHLRGDLPHYPPFVLVG